MSIEDEFKCKGYWGFGNGIELSRHLEKPGALPPYKDPTLSRGMYCSRKPDGCAISLECWTAHRERVDRMFPAMAERITEIIAEVGSGKPAFKKVIEEFGTDPYTTVLMGNMEDAQFIANGQPPSDRKEWTLPYPFRKKN